VSILVERKWAKCFTNEFGHFSRFQAAWMLFYRGRHLKQLGLVGEDSGMLKFTIGLALVAMGGIFAFRFFGNR